MTAVVGVVILVGSIINVGNLSAYNKQTIIGDVRHPIITEIHGPKQPITPHNGQSSNSCICPLRLVVRISSEQGHNVTCNDN